MIVPLKQGLKQNQGGKMSYYEWQVEMIVPLKQGLKLILISCVPDP